MTEREAAILDRMTGGWQRTMDVGGSDASYHSKVLARMLPNGWVERRKGTGMGDRQWKWRITDKGSAALAIHRGLTRLSV